MQYLKKEKSTSKVIRTEVLFTPILVIVPFIVGLIFIYDWYVRGFIEGNSGFTGELMIGVVIISINIIFDIPFIKSLRKWKFLEEISRLKKKK